MDGGKEVEHFCDAPKSVVVIVVVSSILIFYFIKRISVVENEVNKYYLKWALSFLVMCKRLPEYVGIYCQK